MYASKSLSLPSAILLVLLVVVGGCGPSRPDTVPISGKITLDGGSWPNEAMLFFGCVEPAEGYPKRTGKAIVAKDGSFKVGTFGNETDGLMPGKYQVYVMCEGVVNGKTVSYVPDKYQIGSQSGMELEVEPGSQAIDNLLWDVPSKK
ncbi:MAG TPA: hypothetical protein DD670_09585 [Planctomycetaceae bacterium]|nr:hypothetical protein [Planctomycetaceae bacterium]